MFFFFFFIKDSRPIFPEICNVYLCRRQCLMSMPCGSLLLGVQCCYPYFFFLSFYLRTWLMLYWRPTSLCLGSLLFRMFFPYGVIVINNNLNTQLELISICLRNYLIYSFFFFGRATLLPAIKRFLPNHWNQDVITWHFPYFRCMWCPLFYFLLIIILILGVNLFPVNS